jgi:hypothetical protein
MMTNFLEKEITSKTNMSVVSKICLESIAQSTLSKIVGCLITLGIPNLMQGKYT